MNKVVIHKKKHDILLAILANAEANIYARDMGDNLDSHMLNYIQELRKKIEQK